MFKTIARSWNLFIESLSVLRRDRRLLWFPVLSTTATLLVSASLLLPIYGTAGLIRPVGHDAPRRTDPTDFAVGFAFCFLNYFVTIFFNAALVADVERFLDGESATVLDGLRVAFQRLGKIAYWALLATTVAMLLSLVRRRAGPAGKVAAGVASVAWSLVTYFVVPVIVIENRPVWDAVDRSTTLCRQGWGEAATAGAGFGLIWLPFTLPAMGLLYVGLSIHSMVPVTVAVVYVLLLATIASTTKGIFTAALYRYAAHAQGPNWFSSSLLEDAFLPSRGAWSRDDKSKPAMHGTILGISVVPLEKDLDRGELYVMRIEAGATEYHASYTAEELSSTFRPDSWGPGTQVTLQVNGRRLLVSGPGCDGVWCRFTTAAAHRAI